MIDAIRRRLKPDQETDLITPTPATPPMQPSVDKANQHEMDRAIRVLRDILGPQTLGGDPVTGSVRGTYRSPRRAPMKRREGHV